MDNQQHFPIQAARVREHIETLEAHYADVINASGDDLGRHLRACALAIDAYLQSVDPHSNQTRKPVEV